MKRRITRLALGNGGIWAVRSTSATVYYVDLRLQPLLLRQAGAGSSRGAFDGVWLPLDLIESLAADGAVERGVVQVGRRHRYTMDPDPGGWGDRIWWLARVVTSIVELTLAERPTGRPPAPDEYGRPFGGRA